MVTVWVAASLGAILVGLVGFLKSSTEPFNLRKFLATVVTGLISGAGLAVVFVNTEVEPNTLILAFLSGAGIDSARVSISGAIAARVNKK